MGRNKDELIKLAEKITGQECKDVLTKKDALKKIACYYLGEEKEFASIADCLESIVEHGATGGGSGGGSAVLTSIENLSLNKDSEPVTISDEGKTFVFLGNISDRGVLNGLGGEPRNLSLTNSVDVSSTGKSAGTISLDPNAKTITYTPNASFTHGSVTITKIIIG